MSALLLTVLALPLAAALFAALAGPARGRASARIALTGAVLGTAGAVVLLGRVAVSGPLAAVWTAPGHRPWAGFGVDRVTVVLLVLVCAVSALVQGFALRYLAGDRRLPWFVAGTGTLTAASAGLMTSLTLVGLALCWSVAGAGLLLLLGTYPQLPAARDGLRRTAKAFALGDAALWLAVAIATARWGVLDLRHVDARALPDAGRLLPLMGCLVVVAAASRSAQLPFQGWLPATLAAPTPVSALLHAGVINAGGVLLTRLAPLAGGTRPALGLAFVIGAATAVYGTVLMLAKPDVKGALAHSTMGQMGFLMMTCGLGLYSAAVIHLVLHGLYKASLFLASGTAVHTRVAAAAAPGAPVPSPSGRRLLTASGLLVPGLLLAGAVRLLDPALARQAGSVTLLLFAWATASAALLGWLRRQPAPGALAAATPVLAAVLAGYVALLKGADGWLAPALPVPASALPGTGWLLAAAFAVLAVATVLTRSTACTGRLADVQRAFYVLALNSGHVRLPEPPPSRKRAARALEPSGLTSPQPVQVQS